MAQNFSKNIQDSFIYQHLNNSQVDKAAVMINELLEQSDDIRNEHKRLQLRELAALNGTLKDEQICYICGDFTHAAAECPKAQSEVYKLPTGV